MAQFPKNLRTIEGHFELPGQNIHNPLIDLFRITNFPGDWNRGMYDTYCTERDHNDRLYCYAMTITAKVS